MFPVEAQTAGEELERIKTVYHGITPECVVNESTHDLDVLHYCFEWDNEKAGREHRKQQARVIINNIVVIVQIETPEGSEPDTRIVRAFHNITSKETTEKIYISLSDAIKDPTYRKQVLDTAKKEFIALKAKYIDLTECSDYFKRLYEVL